jgi:hypothetical protein
MRHGPATGLELQHTLTSTQFGVPHRQPPLSPAYSCTPAHPAQRVGHCMQHFAGLPDAFMMTHRSAAACLCLYFFYPDGRARASHAVRNTLALQAASHKGRAQALAVQAANLHLQHQATQKRTASFSRRPGHVGSPCSMPRPTTAARHTTAAHRETAQRCPAYLLTQLLVHQVVAGTPVEAAAVQQLGGLQQHDSGQHRVRTSQQG